MELKRVSIAISPEVFEQVQILAKDELRTPSTFLRIVVENAIRNIVAHKAVSQQQQPNVG